MVDKRFKGRILAGMLCGVGVILAGCHTEGRQAKVARRATTSLEDTRLELVKSDQQVNQALTAMDQLAAEPRDLKPVYKSFAAEVSDTARQAEEARRRAHAMQLRWQDYIANWEQEADRLASEELRAGAAERRQTVREDYNRLRDAARNLQTVYEPFVRQLRDIQSALSLDLTPAGIDAAKPAMQTAHETGTQLQQQIDAFIKELDNVSAARGTESTPSRPVAGSEP